MIRRYFAFALVLFALSACESPSGGEPVMPDEAKSPIVIAPYYTTILPEVEGEQMPETKGAPEMVDFPGSGTFKPYTLPVSIFGFFLQDRNADPADSKGCFGETREEVLAHVTASPQTISDQHAADVLQETVNDVAPSREYTQFMNNAEYVYSTHMNVEGAYVSNDIAAFWRPDAYHYLICYAPPLSDASLVAPLVVSLRTEIHGIQDDPDYNFLYGRRVLQYNDSKENTNLDPHPYHKTEGIRMRLMPMLAKINFHLKCSEDLKGSSVLFAVRVTTYKAAQFHLDSGTWELHDDYGNETITRYYDNDYVIPTEWNPSEKNFTLSLFPNLTNADDPVVTGSADPSQNTPIIVRKLEVCVNNTWVEVLNLEEKAGDPANPDLTDPTVSEIIPLAPGYSTDIFLTVSPKAAAGMDDWNKLIVTFSNWKRDDVYEYEGVLE